MAMAAGGPNGGGGGKMVSLRLQYYCVFAAVGVAVIVLSLTFLSPSAMGAVRQNLGTVVANSGAGERQARQAVAAVVAKPEPEPEAEKVEEKKEPPVVLFNFGDSNSDTGGVAAASTSCHPRAAPTSATPPDASPTAASSSTSSVSCSTTTS
ncbi:uncharacterized protein [Lolium perenne]|jgi:hypothetical protein|uniref:uncharacterized protein n=1 Tax=Lolium perenne TaxID=4522 RepID=UPI0021EA0BE2